MVHRFWLRIEILLATGLVVAFSGVLSGALSGCAYSMGIEDRRLPEGYKLVSVPVFKNTTQEVGVEVPFTNAMIREFARSQVAKVVDKSEAQVVLEGTVDRVTYEVSNSCTRGVGCPIPGNTMLNSEYRVTVSAKMVLKRASDGRALWSQDFSGQKIYPAPRIGLAGLNSANALYNHSSRQENLSAIAGDMMAEAHGRLTENF
jgi:hypothetical protein